MCPNYKCGIRNDAIAGWTAVTCGTGKHTCPPPRFYNDELAYPYIAWPPTNRSAYPLMVTCTTCGEEIEVHSFTVSWNSNR